MRFVVFLVGCKSRLVVDDLLIDIKTTKYLELKREYFDQLIGYYILSKISLIDKAPKKHEIKRLGVYFSRHGFMCTYNVDEIIDQRKLNRFIPWFKETAQSYFKWFI